MLSVKQVLERASMSALALASLSSGFRQFMAFFMNVAKSSGILPGGALSSLLDRDHFLTEEGYSVSRNFPFSARGQFEDFWSPTLELVLISCLVLRSLRKNGRTVL